MNLETFMTFLNKFIFSLLFLYLYFAIVFLLYIHFINNISLSFTNWLINFIYYNLGKYYRPH